MTLGPGRPGRRRWPALRPAIPDDQLNDPTPCPGTDVAGMLAHVLGLSVAFRDAARESGGTDHLHPAWAGHAAPGLAGTAAACGSVSSWRRGATRSLGG